MKVRTKQHDDWATDPAFYEKLNAKYNFDFDPCPFQHDLTKWNGLEIEWGQRNFVNPPYTTKLKEAFILKAIEESRKGKLCVMLLPVSTGTKIFHEQILPNSNSVEFIQGRLKFIGVNKYGEYVNWHLWDRKAPEGVTHVKGAGQFDSKIVIFDGRNK